MILFQLMLYLWQMLDLLDLLSVHLVPLHNPLRWNYSFCSFCTVLVTDSLHLPTLVF
ncbi:hypothetical protein LDENG_00059480 [Lucifuga dentata]|nr:hypothetical protein LDENG_00059480 [Lucifuga dentata]